MIASIEQDTEGQANALIEISESLLVKLAGQAAYERGSAYCDDGRVSSVDSKLDRSNVARGAWSVLVRRLPLS